MTEAENYANEWRLWHYLREHGGQDPFYSDGSNMNLVRNHLIASTRRGYKPPDDMPIPPVVDYDYMARADEIREAGRAALVEMEHDEHYSQLAVLVHELPDGTKKERAVNVLRYLSGLRMAINDDDLITMRRYEKNKSLFRAAREFMDDFDPAELTGQQISLFSLLV